MKDTLPGGTPDFNARKSSYNKAGFHTYTQNTLKKSASRFKRFAKYLPVLYVATKTLECTHMDRLGNGTGLVNMGSIITG
jgi:hypothetical protein